MQAYGGGNAADQYLVQRIQGATKEQLAAMLLEGAERFLNGAIQAMERHDIQAKARYVNRVSAIIEELTIWLDLESGGELAVNLARIYGWWINELFEGSQSNDTARLTRILQQMGDIRTAWQQRATQPPPGATPDGGGSLDGWVG